MNQDEHIRTARAGLSQLMEPNDLTGLALVEVAGPVDAYRLISAHTGKAPAAEQQAVAELLGAADVGGSALRLDAGLERWRPRVRDAAPERDLATLRRLGGGLLVPEDPAWPGQFDALGLGAPLCLWWRGALDPSDLPGPEALLAVVGSRDATDYGRTVTAELVHQVVHDGVAVVSGGAYGIDARAHEAAMAAYPPAVIGVRPTTVAVMAGGLDRFYPAGNEELLRRVAGQGVLFAEVAPGTAPTRWRFLQRNRLIAALCGATLVIEARWRSGALTTARRAAEMGREVGAVPGSVLSANSAGCHRLIREGAATAVTDAAEALELLGSRALVAAGGGGAPTGAAASVSGARHDAGTASSSVEVRERARNVAAERPHDGLDIQDLLLLDALPVRGSSAPDKLATVAGLGIGAVLGGLSRLQERGLARRSGDGWQRAPGD